MKKREDRAGSRLSNIRSALFASIVLALLFVPFPAGGQPAYNIAHMTNTTTAVNWAVGKGANGVEIDLQFGTCVGGACLYCEEGRSCPYGFYHAGSCDCSCDSGTSPEHVCTPLGDSCFASSDTYSLLGHIARTNLALVYIDSKVNENTDPVAGASVIALLENELFGAGYRGIVIVGAPELSDFPYLEQAALRAATSPYKNRIYFGFDQVWYGMTPVAIANLQELPSQNLYYGIGITSCLADTFYTEISSAVLSQELGYLDITGIWTIDREESMRTYLDLGVQGVVTNRPGVLAAVLASRGTPLATPVVPASLNLAGKPTSQSSTGWNASASRAVDGNTSGNWGDNSITHTQLQADPWWQVDLGELHRIDKVTVYNRTDCCAERLNGFVVDFLAQDGSLIRSYQHNGAAGRRTEIPVGIVGRYVRVRLPGAERYLSLAEVQIHGSRVSSDNVALGKPVSQSSTAFDSPATRAVDGNRNGNWGESSVTHTAPQASPWWQVDLGETKAIDKVVIYNRTDCCSERLDNFVLETLAENGSVTFSHTHGTAEARNEIAVGRSGRYVKIRLTGKSSHYLSLAEVEVYVMP